MPTYQYQCDSCETIFECFESYKENKENPPTHCPRCDPDVTGPPTLYKYFGNTRPGFKLNGEGVFDNRFQP